MVEDFPPSAAALTDPNGLLAVGGDLSVERLLLAYSRGIFPWFSEGEPILWWTPDPRAVLFPDQFKLSKSLRKSLKNRHFQLSCDTQFEAVMRACAAPRRDGHGTWISEAMVSAYSALHRQGIAHSVEVHLEGELVGGLYGVNLGRMFYGESMFARVTDASKTALAALVWLARQGWFELIDCQVESEHLFSLGASNIPRERFEKLLAQAIKTGNDAHRLDQRKRLIQCKSDNRVPAWTRLLPEHAAGLLEGNVL